MLTSEDKTRLNKAFAGENSKESTTQQAEEIASRTKVPLRAVECFALEKGLLPSRYQRNIGSFGLEGQKKLLESKVIVVGLGGLGGFVIEELARAGVGQIVGVDYDIFDETNLNRQLLAEQDSLGGKKIDLALERLQKVNPAVEFTGLAVKVEKLPDEIWQDANLVFDCLDNIDDRFLLADKCSDAGLTLVHGAIGGWYGQVAIVWPGSEMLEKMYKQHRRGIEKFLGNPVFTAAAAASLMTAEGIKLLTGKTTEKSQQVLFFDLLQNEWQTIKI